MAGEGGIDHTNKVRRQKNPPQRVFVLGSINVRT
nr:MAG TPA: hypothetical protein [Caudoviricetes sp.]